MRDKKFFYNGFADVFDEKMNMYDLTKRIRIVFNDLLPEGLRGKRLLDAGCGTGWFSREAVQREARVVSFDVGTALLKQAEAKCSSEKVAGDALALPFKDNVFDFVISTEVIEHTVEPFQAIREIQRVLKPGGLLALTTPNRNWHFAVWIANIFKLRPYEGYEHWVRWGALKKHFGKCGLTIETMTGFHLFPFVLAFSYPLLDYCDRFGKVLGPGMLNIAVRARKTKEGPADV